ncbi:hypothetical protein R5R35_014063 [Gryllus longicercus]|uniref:Uncharacterized protein n=1 Tax=Gryllus longicercus TaxID=2509291 RepID=A0AAN9VZY7_9ORTH
MKIESEKFRNWKLQRERELSKLRDQDRKRQNQLIHMERLHTKQQNVWKRKVEEAVAINKRLKDALALQKATQERRGNMSSAMKVQTWLAQELEIIYSIIARRIRNKPVVNQDPKAALIAKLKQDLQETQLELMNLDRNSQCTEEHKRLEEENTNLAGKNMKLTEALHNAFAKNTNLIERALLAEVARDRMMVKLCELQAEYGKSMDNLNQTMDPSTCPVEFWEQLKHLRY